MKLDSEESLHQNNFFLDLDGFWTEMSIPRSL
jgi:hypothetical protein